MDKDAAVALCSFAEPNSHKASFASAPVMNVTTSTGFGGGEAALPAAVASGAHCGRDRAGSSSSSSSAMTESSDEDDDTTFPPSKRVKKTRAAIQSRKHQKSSTVTPKDRWCVTEMNAIVNARVQGLTYDEVCKMFPERTTRAVQQKIHNLQQKCVSFYEEVKVECPNVQVDASTEQRSNFLGQNSTVLSIARGIFKIPKEALPDKVLENFLEFGKQKYHEQFMAEKKKLAKAAKMREQQMVMVSPNEMKAAASGIKAAVSEWSATEKPKAPTTRILPAPTHGPTAMGAGPAGSNFAQYMEYCMFLEFQKRRKERAADENVAIDDD